MRYARLADIRWQVRMSAYTLKTVMLTVHNTSAKRKERSFG
jgi:hypothetical protein